MLYSCVRCRAKTVKLLESSPLQIAMCVLVLIDAGIVVAEILLDLHAIRCEYTRHHLPYYHSSSSFSSLLPTPTLSVGVGGIFESVRLSVCPFVCLSAAYY